MTRALPMAKARLPEKLVQSQIVNLLRSIGGVVYTLGTRRPRGSLDFSTRQTAGIPDLYAFLPAPAAQAAIGASALWIEVKTATGRASPEQLAFESWCTLAKVPYVRGGVDDVVAFLMRTGHLKPDNVPHYRLPKGRPDGQDETA
jgi:hypothetical protein